MYTLVIIPKPMWEWCYRLMEYLSCVVLVWVTWTRANRCGGWMGLELLAVNVTPLSHGYRDVTATYIRRAKILSHIYVKHQYR